jgi:uncharacterized protein YqkB
MSPAEICGCSCKGISHLRIKDAKKYYANLMSNFEKISCKKLKKTVCQQKENPVT